MTWEKALALDEHEEHAAAPASSTAATITPPTAEEPGPAVPRRRSTPAERRQRRRRRRNQGKRLDIQGLRALAVLAVVVNHLFGWPKGGFLGVDVFFVISGYLITSLMLREEGREGRISLLNFYRRRVKRLMPAAVLVTVLTVLAALWLFGAGRARTVLVDGLWATGFAANWRMVVTGTDYFQSYGPVSPLRHYWSLSVEEQFYLVWPLALILAFAAARALRMERRTATLVSAGAAAAVLTLASLAVAAAQTASSPVVAYFSTFTRGWELGIGALLAIVVPRLSVPRGVVTAMSWTGLVVIVVSLFVVDERGMPFPGAIVPCLGAALVVAAFSRGVEGRNAVLSNRVAAYIGDISYSVYLVHFPVIVFALALVREPSVAQYVAVLLVVAGLSILSYHFVENPLRSRPWSWRRTAPAGRRSRSSRSRSRSSRGRAWTQAEGLTPGRAAVVAAACLIAATATVVVTTPAESSTDRLQAQVLAALAAPPASSEDDAADAADSPEVTGPATDAVQAQVRAALGATSWPNISPAFDQPTVEPNRGCPSGPLPPASACTWGDPAAPKTLYLVGDSTSAAYFGAFETLLANHPDWKMRLGSGAGCPFAARQVFDGDGNSHTPECRGRNAALTAEIQQVKPDLIVFTSTNGSDDFMSAIGPQLALIRPAAAKMVVLPAPPHITNPNDCYTTLSSPTDCTTPVPDEYADWLSNEAALAQQNTATFLNPTPWFCTNGYCPAFAGTTPQRKDGVHMTYDYSVLLAPAVDEALTERGLLS